MHLHQHAGIGSTGGRAQLDLVAAIYCEAYRAGITIYVQCSRALAEQMR